MFFSAAKIQKRIEKGEWKIEKSFHVETFFFFRFHFSIIFVSLQSRNDKTI